MSGEPGPEIGDVVKDRDRRSFGGETVGRGDEDGVGCVGEVADPESVLVSRFCFFCFFSKKKEESERGKKGRKKG